MKYEAKLNLTQAPALTLNTALLQAIKLLPMARQELDAVIRQELTENPMLEEVAVEADGDTPTEEDDVSPPDVADSVTEGPELDEINWAAYVPDDWEWKAMPAEEHEERGAFEHPMRATTTLQEHLLLQLMTATDDAGERRVGAFLIGNLDEAGYLRCDVGETMAATQADRTVIERVLATVQSFDPAGVGARDLRECLRLQIRTLGLEGTLLDTITSDFLPLIEHRGLAHINDVAKEVTKRLGLPPAEVALALRMLRTLDPRPGLRLASEPLEAIVPDIIVRKVGQDYQVFLNDEGLPRLRLNTTYRRLLRDGQPEEKHYVADKLRAAVELIRGIEQCRQTLQKVATSIVKFQREFFEFGLAHLKPLVLKDVAADIGMHESTVSRVTTHKYMDTERGLFELKYFFHSRLESYDGQTLSSRTIKDRLKKLVATEDPTTPLTDQQLVERLAAESIKIARRTVGKYRHELKLPPANRRKRSPEG